MNKTPDSPIVIYFNYSNPMMTSAYISPLVTPGTDINRKKEVTFCKSGVFHC